LKLLFSPIILLSVCDAVHRGSTKHPAAKLNSRIEIPLGTGFCNFQSPTPTTALHAPCLQNFEVLLLIIISCIVDHKNIRFDYVDANCENRWASIV